MSSSRHAKTLERACDGEHLAIWGLAGQQQLEIVLSELLAERESRGSRVPVVSLLMRGREDAEWIERAVRWLSLRGRRVIVRTRVVMPRPVVTALHQAHGCEDGCEGRRGGGAVVELELAHHKPAIQRALLGQQADPAAALLLQAQHLETLEIPVVARLGPLMPGIHDQGNGFTPLLRNVEAADVSRIVLQIGQLHPQQIRALVDCQRELTAAGVLELARAYGVSAMTMLGGTELPADEDGVVHKLKSRRAQAFTHGLERLVTDAGLELPGCGCQSHCELTPQRAANDYEAGYESVMGRDLFAGLAGC
ncbi:hypothetical protein ENSA5_64810 [Enhygromyxa salina]|uniref:Uncharacterized protein n=1 Tax=Enhygromyxa salina TaxID=215803 RepID=A0A2S9XC88_9BACT|nr:hypothetical protein [Enhygromyxa salina]PRP90467.1 hypothetical protein ENSA5_64810 [Enhygromyxa salina]